MKKLLLFTAISLLAGTFNAQNFVFNKAEKSFVSAPEVNATIVKNYHSSSKDAFYNPPDSPAPLSYNSNTYTELGWTEINVTETDIIGVVTVDYTWGTDLWSWEGSFHLESPSGTSIVFASHDIIGTYSVSMTDFFGETMDGTWILWIEDSFGDGGLQATNITVTFSTILAHDLGVSNILPEYVHSGESAIPQVEVYNFGLNDETTYSVNFSDGDSYDETINVSAALISNSGTVIDFPEWSPADGIYTGTATITLSGDENPTNDICTGTCFAGTGVYPTEIVYSYDAWGDNAYNVLLLPLTTGVLQPLINSVIGDPFTCAEYMNGSVYAFQFFTNDIYIILADGHAVQIGTLSGLPADFFLQGFAYDQVNDIMYTTGMINGESFLYSVDTFWNCTLVGPMINQMVGLATDAVGDLYAVDVNYGHFWSIDKATGSQTYIGYIGYDLTYSIGMGGDKVADVIYGTIWDHFNGIGHFGTFDVTTGGFTPINSDLGGVLTMCAVIPGEQSSAHVTFMVDNKANTSYTGFALKGTWDAEGNYDATWNGDEEHTDFYDDGTHGDAVPGDAIWTVMVQLFPDGGTNTWEWGVNDQDGNWIEGNFQFSVPDVSPQTLTYTTLGTNSISRENISIYPNPSTGVFFVNVEDNYELEIIDITGRVINNEVLTGNSTIEIKTSGIYYFKFSNNEGSVIQSVIVQ